MRTVAAPTQAELGLNSMVDILSGIAQDTNTSNSILNLFSKEFTFSTELITFQLDELTV